MTMGFFRLVSTVALIAGASSSACASDFRFSMDQCLKSKVASVKVEHCTAVIQQSNDPGILERAFTRRGLANMELNRFGDAVSDFSAVIRLNPRVAGFYDNRQNAYKSLGRLGDALNDANTAVRLATNYAFVYRSRGIVYGEMGRFDLAIQDYTTAISLDPRNAGLLFDRGKILLKAGRLQEAIIDFTHAFDLDRTLALALRERGLANKKLGNLEAASADLKLYFGVQPNDVEVAQALQELQPQAPRNLVGAGGRSDETSPTPEVIVQKGEQNTAPSLTSESASALNKRIGDLAAQIDELTKVLTEQKALRENAGDSRPVIDQTINVVTARIETLKSEYNEKDGAFSRYLTSIGPNDRDLYLTARKASEIYPKIPYYIPGTRETGEFWVEPGVTESGEQIFSFKFIDPNASVSKVRLTINMSPEDMQETQRALLKLREWSETAHQNKVRKAFEKRVVCFPMSECPPGRRDGCGKVVDRVAVQHIRRRIDCGPDTAE